MPDSSQAQPEPVTAAGPVILSAKRVRARLKAKGWPAEKITALLLAFETAAAGRRLITAERPGQDSPPAQAP